MSWDIDVSGHDSIVLTVQHDGEIYTKTFKAGKPVVFNLKDMPSDVPLDGPYDYQLSVVPTLSNGLKKQLEAGKGEYQRRFEDNRFACAELEKLKNEPVKARRLGGDDIRGGSPNPGRRRVGSTVTAGTDTPSRHHPPPHLPP